MGRKLIMVFLLALGFISTSCVTRHQSAGNSVNITEVDMMKVDKMKKGEACRNNILFLFWWGDDLITNAAKNGKIRKVAFLEGEVRTYFVFNQFCTIAYGESSGGGSGAEGSAVKGSKSKEPKVEE